MKLLGQKHLTDFIHKHSDVQSQLKAWRMEVEEATWKTPQEIKDRYQHASFLSGNRVIFNIKGNKYRIDTKINYSSEIVFVKRIGTHAEYSKWTY
ncbi:type II toxin-antitoxin system HigB family toxin [candidate division KSB1 bacterium]|nr:type II toxin-antitoxin system HigB family toxin [candidate division KSB1 bacterium]